MADGVVLNAGSGGETAATDDCGVAGQAQIVKLAISTDGSATLIPAEATNGLDVDVTRIVPGTSATHLGKAEDVASAGGDTGVAILSVRQDSAISDTSADGDYAFVKSDSAGRVYVNASGAAVPITDNSGSITVDGTVAVTSADIATIAGAVAGTEMQVDVLTMPSVAVTNAGLTELAAAINASSQMDVNIAASSATVTVSGTVTANLAAGTNNIGDVDVLSVVPGTGATNLGKAIDSAGGATDTGVAVLAIRDDALSALTPIEGDYVPLRVNSTGALHVTGGGGGTQYAVDDIAGATDTGTLLLAVRDDSLAALTPADGDYTQLRVSSTGALHVTGGGGGTEYTVDVAAPAAPTGATFVMERDDALSALTEIEGDWTNPRASANGALWVSVDGTATVSGTVTANLAAGTNNIGDVDILSIAAGDNNIGNVDIVSLPASTNTLEVVGDVAQDAAVAGNPVLSGLRASTAIPTAMSADGDSVYAWADLNGATVVAGRIVDDAAFTVGTSRVHPVGLMADETATDSVDEGDAGIPRMTLDRKTITTPYPHTAGGLSIFRSLDLDESEEEVKASAGQIYAVWVTNTATTTRWIKFYNLTAANTTVGTSTPVITIGVPGNSTDDISGNFGPGGMGITFDTAISVAATTGVADADTGAPAANDVIINIFYK